MTCLRCSSLIIAQCLVCCFYRDPLKISLQDRQVKTLAGEVRHIVHSPTASPEDGWAGHSLAEEPAHIADQLTAPLANRQASALVGEIGHTARQVMHEAQHDLVKLRPRLTRFAIFAF